MIGGRAAAAAIYPQALCKTVCEAIKEQLEEDAVNTLMMINQVQEAQSEGGQQANPVFIDHVQGGYLDPTKVTAARRTELEYIEKMKSIFYS